MSRLHPLQFDCYDWRHFDNASAEVANLSIFSAETGITGTTEGIVFQTPAFAAGDALLGQGGFWYPGKAVRLWVSGTLTTAATPGTITLNQRLDSITGASMGASVAITQIASITNATWVYQAYFVCRSVGTAGTLWGQGQTTFNTTVVTATSPGRTWLLPDITPAVATINTTTAHSLCLTALFSVTGDTMTAQQGFCEVLN